MPIMRPYGENIASIASLLRANVLRLPTNNLESIEAGSVEFVQLLTGPTAGGNGLRPGRGGKPSPGGGTRGMIGGGPRGPLGPILCGPSPGPGAL